eukprot:GHRR01025223.1.p1 GENE.GHRR01025223.1~~GHRR01025223.1.p1  ORF type:complete len:117 (-),score=16.05 GHRR01025223.1:549-899(-)
MWCVSCWVSYRISAEPACFICYRHCMGYAMPGESRSPMSNCCSAHGLDPAARAARVCVSALVSLAARQTPAPAVYMQRTCSPFRSQYMGGHLGIQLVIDLQQANAHLLRASTDMDW